MTGADTTKQKHSTQGWGGLLLVLFTLGIAVAMTWRKWPDILIDFGFQLYLPWQISTGKVLGRDVMYLPGGPLSIYYHALLFKCFGVSFFTIIISNLLILAGTLTLIYRRFLAVTDQFTATLIGLAIVLVFACGQYSETGNYNFLSPYAHEVVHGLALSIAAIALLSSWLTKEKIRYAAFAGISLGLAFLTKPEVFVALSFGVFAAFILSLRIKPKPFTFKSFAAFSVCAFVPVLTFSLFFSAGFRVVLSPWQALFSRAIEKNPLYLWCLGLDTPVFNIKMMFFHGILLGTILFFLALICRRKMTQAKNRIFLVAFTAFLLALASSYNWADCGRSLPFLVLAAGYLCLIGKRPAIFPFLWSVFALFLLAKLGLYPRIWHYGFALAMPAFVTGIYLLVWLLPERLERFHVQPRLFRSTIALVLFTGISNLYLQSQYVYQDKTIPVGQDRDTIMAYKAKRSLIGPAINQALDWMQKNTPPEATLAVLPEGTIVKVLARRVNPTLYPAWHPPELEAFGQGNMIAAFRAHAPDYVMLIHRDSAEYGRKYFGQEDRFGRELMQWIGKNYQPVELIGHEPLTNMFFGIKILKKR